MTGDERLAKVAEVLNTCTCTPHPFGDGPEIDCPMHGRSDYQAQALAPLLEEFRVEDEARALWEAAVAIERLRQENPMNGDGSNHALDRVLGVLDRLAGDAGPSDAAVIARKRITEERVRDYLRLEQENADRAALAAAEPDAGER